MALMKAIQVRSPGAGFELIHKEIPTPKPNEVLIKVTACGICHGDSIVHHGHFPGIKYPIIPGHEVMGTIEKAGSLAGEWQPGQRVGIGWHGGHCLVCPECRKGEFGSCKKALITGLSTDGGYAEYMIARHEALVNIPNEVDFLEGAPLLCAGRTTFGGLKYSQARAGDLVVIQGLGGLGHLAVQYAAKMGFKTVVLSRGKDKEKHAYTLGAHFYIDTSTADPVKELNQMGGAKVILCTAPNSKSIAALIPALGLNGEIINVTGASEPMQIPPMLLLHGGRSIKGWVSGNIEETIDFSSFFKIKSIVELFPLEKVQQAYDKMMNAQVYFRSVLKIGN